MSSQDLLDRLQKINRNDYDAAALSSIDAWIAQVEEAEMVRAIADMDIVKRLVERARRIVKDIDAMLLTKREMETLERLNLLDRKELYQDFINMFDVDKSIEKLTREIDQHL